MKKIGCCQRLLLILHLLLIVVFAVACADHHVSSWQQIQPRPAGTPLTIWIATDLHYLSEDLTDEGTLFLSTMENGDGKLTECTPEILDEFVAQVLKARPDALILSGDLTFNGERKSLEDLTEKLNEVQDAGIPVLVIPGNHDIDYPLAFDYEGDSYTMAENITMDSFRQICGGLGYDMAMSRDESSFSYMYQLAEDVQILMLDGNTSEAPGAMGEDTLDWAEKQLKAARENERMVFSVSHQNVLPQNQLLYYGFAFYNYEDVAALLQKYGVTANFSGHSHIQHVSQDQGLKDYATGPLSVSPLRYGIITVDEERNISYQMTSLAEAAPDSAVAAELTLRASERYTICNRRQIMASLKALQQETGFSEAELEIMASFVLEVNQAYFAGTLSGQQEYLASEGWELWTCYGQEDFWWHYLNGILHETP